MIVLNKWGVIMFTFTITARNLHNYGVIHTQCEAECKEAMNALKELRKQTTINYIKESQIINKLAEITMKLDSSTSQSALDLANKGVKMCVGPVAGVVTKVVTNVAKRQMQDGQSTLISDVSDSLIKIGKEELIKQATATTISQTLSWGADILGATALSTAVITAPVLAGAAALTGGVLLAYNPELRKRCWDGVSNTVIGTKSLVNEAALHVFQKENINKKIIESYSLYERKRMKFISNIAFYFAKKIEFEKNYTDIKMQQDSPPLESEGEKLHQTIISFYNQFESELIEREILLSSFTQMPLDGVDQDSVLDNFSEKMETLALKILKTSDAVKKLEDAYLANLESDEERGLSRFW